MLVQKENEIKRLKEKTIGGRKESNLNSGRNLNNSGIDSDDDALSQVYQSDGSSDDDSDSSPPKIRKQVK